MNALQYAQQHYLDVAVRTEGKNAKEVAAAVASRAEQLKMQTRGSVQAALGSSCSPSNADEQAEAARAMRRVERETGVDGVHARTVSDAAEHLEKGAEDLEKAAEGMHAVNTVHEGGVAGTAYLGQAGSQTFDAAKMAGEDTVVSGDNAKGVLVHEHEHTQQARQNISAVRFGGSALSGPVDQDTPDADTVTATDLTETGAIVAQVEAAPESFEFLSDHYKARYHKVLSYGVSTQRVRELARKEDGLEIFAKEAAIAA